jgi:hypothetical protein
MTASSSIGSFVALAGAERGVPGDEPSEEAEDRDSRDSPKMASCVSFSFPLSPEDVRELGSSAAGPMSSTSMLSEDSIAESSVAEILLRADDDAP